MKATAQLYTLRDFCKDAQGIHDTMKKLNEIGYRAVEIAGAADIDPKLMREYADKFSLEIVSTHRGFENIQANPQAEIDIHKTYGASYIGIGGMPQKYTGSAELIKQFAKEASEVGKITAEQGIKFIYHNHNWEFAKVDGKTLMETLAENSDPKYFLFELDLHWVQAGGASPTAWIKKLAGRVDVLHFKDFTMNGHDSAFAEVGEGNLDWESIIPACEEAGVKYAVVEQDNCYGQDPFECVKTSFDNMMKMGIEA